MANWLERLRQNFLWGGLGDEYKSYLGKGIRYALLLRMGFGGWESWVPLIKLCWVNGYGTLGWKEIICGDGWWVWSMGNIGDNRQSRYLEVQMGVVYGGVLGWVGRDFQAKYSMWCEMVDEWGSSMTYGAGIKYWRSCTQLQLVRMLPFVPNWNFGYLVH